MTPFCQRYLEEANLFPSTLNNSSPVEQQCLDLRKEEFRDMLCLRYNLPSKGLPSKCACSESFNINHALSCEKGGIVGELNKVCTNVRSETHLIPTRQ